MLQLDLSTGSLLFCLAPLIFFFFFFKSINVLPFSNSSKKPGKSVPKSYPFFGSYFSLRANHHRIIQWASDAILSTPTLSYTLHRPFSPPRVMTANPAVVQHILKTNFPTYVKGEFSIDTFSDFLGSGIFNVDGQSWKFQRRVASHEFNTRSLRNFVENVVDAELNDRLLPILAATAAADVHDRSISSTLDFQDILQRFAFDNICKIAFGYDPAYLTPSLPQAEFAVAFEDATFITSERLRSISPLIWKTKRFFNIGSEKKLGISLGIIREFARKLIKEKKEELEQQKSSELDDHEESVDLLSRFLSTGHSDENFVADIIISFILAGRDTTSAALSWFFWLVSKNPQIEEEILKEVNHEKSSELGAAHAYDEVKDMVYTHAAICESMRLYPPVPSDTKEATEHDVLPDGTVVKKGMGVTYHPYAMGRVKEVWGEDWAEYRPERWLEREKVTGKWRFVGRDPYTYPVFQAGPRICLGKEMAFLQMKRLVAGVLRRFRVVPAFDDGAEPVYVSYLTSKMKFGFPVKIEERQVRD